MADSVRGRVLWYELLTSDRKAAENFYSTVIGWTVTPFREGPEAYDMFMRGPETPVAGCMNIPEGMNFPPHWEMYVGVDKLEDAVSRIEQLGGSALGPQIDIPDVGRMRTMMDPQSAVFAIYEPSSVMPEREPQVGDGSWHELMTTDAEAAMKFYTELFGWKADEPMDMGEMGKYHIFSRTAMLGGMMNKAKELANVPPNWGVYFRVADINAALERVKANGGQVWNGPMQVPGGSTVANCVDPQGAAFSLHQQ